MCVRQTHRIEDALLARAFVTLECDTSSLSNIATTAARPKPTAAAEVSDYLRGTDSGPGPERQEQEVPPIVVSGKSICAGCLHVLRSSGNSLTTKKGRGIMRLATH
uniref:Uncharacterized protein n=1 Tax=Knipowitschia caucasica TaxID=637954 RepID=A0AAV2KSC8_KNICA